MEERIIRLPELMMFHQITEVWNESIACFSMDSSMKNISKVPPVLADMFSFILVEEGTARYVLNYKEYTVQGGDLLLFSPSMLVSLVNSSDDFKSRNLMCERSLFEHMLSSNPAYQTYSYYFCRSDTPVVRLERKMQEALRKYMEQIRLSIVDCNVYQKEIIQCLMHACMLLVLEVIEERVSALPQSDRHALCRGLPPACPYRLYCSADCGRAKFLRPVGFRQVLQVEGRRFSPALPTKEGER